MNARMVSQASDLICRTMKTRVTPAGIAAALDAAGMLQSPETAAELERLRARVAELENPAPPAEYPSALPWAELMDDEDRADFLDELAASSITNADSKTALAEVEDTCGRWRAIAEAQHAHNTAPGPDTQEPEHPAPCRWPASPGCACAGPVPYALTTQATSALAGPSVDKLRGILAPSPKAGG
ncbi:hypothetical protein ACGFWI_00955 [Streptomyces sp. NPDC048434]|uniref:hypothetical protein n=1 Tax=Streptomyces sp. NPDC048434 TaxID=3365549 RepID=UPI003724B56F